MKNWTNPSIKCVYVKDTEKYNNGNHFGWNNSKNPHYNGKCNCGCECDCCDKDEDKLS